MPRKEPPSWTSGGKVVKVDRVEWITMADAQTAVNALQSGDIDFMENPSFDLLPVLAANKDHEALATVIEIGPGDLRHHGSFCRSFKRSKKTHSLIDVGRTDISDLRTFCPSNGGVRSELTTSSKSVRSRVAQAKRSGGLYMRTVAACFTR
jgi:hypothetical protein